MTPGSPVPGSGAFFRTEGKRLRVKGKPTVREEGANLVVEFAVAEDLSRGDNRTLTVTFEERTLSVQLTPRVVPLSLSFEWDLAKAALIELDNQRAAYRWQGFEYSVGLEGLARATWTGWEVSEDRGPIVLDLAQKG